MSMKEERQENMSLSRRQALLAILTAPSGVESLLERTAQDQNGGLVHLLSNRLRFSVTLVDKDEKDDGQSGIYELEVNYKGEKLTLSAKEIWNALHEPNAAPRPEGLVCSEPEGKSA